MPPSATSPLRVLLVEDNDYLRDTIAILLEADDREVVTCADAEEALAHDRARPFDVVLTDVSLAGMSGIELAREVLRERPERWVVLLSGYAIDPATQALGPNVRALAKPFEVAAVEAVLEEAQGRPSLGEA